MREKRIQNPGARMNSKEYNAFLLNSGFCHLSSAYEAIK